MGGVQIESWMVTLGISVISAIGIIYTTMSSNKSNMATLKETAARLDRSNEDLWTRMSDTEKYNAAHMTKQESFQEAYKEVRLEMRHCNERIIMLNEQIKSAPTMKETSTIFVSKDTFDGFQNSIENKIAHLDALVTKVLAKLEAS